MAMNPFEVRLDVMKMAQQMVEQEHHAKMMEYQGKVAVVQDSMRTTSSTAAWEVEKSMNLALGELAKLQVPKAPTAEEVIKRAEALYSFVNTRDANTSAPVRTPSGK